MDKSKVFFTNLHTTPSSNLLDKMERLIKRAGIESIDFKDQFVAIKIHFGEPGNLAYLRPNYAARLATLLRSWGAKPFLTDCHTLYSGRRANAVDHLQSAMENGFNPISAQCQVIIGDGLKGTEYREIPLNGEYCPAPKIGAAIADADVVISMNHFKGHEQAGFGGALKNLGMGCASVGGKLELHASSQPKIDTGNCIGCNICVKHCAHDAVHMNAERKAEIDYAKCVGCGQCVALCQHDAAVVSDWDTSERLNYKIAEYPSSHAAFSNKDVCIKAIRMERKLELAMEGERWFDLSRWGGDVMASELKAYVDYEKQYISKFAGASYLSSKKTMLPVPDDEILTLGTDPETGTPYLVQPEAWRN